MFEAGTKSAETPRTGASAPSLNAMGADVSRASQPVVRRALSAAPDAGPGDSANDEQAFLRKQQEKRERDEDKVAADNGEFFERIVDALEQRVLDELERRGHRRTPGVF